ncbi:MAG: hypothetical protein H6Q67_1413 [Firmicutes bacterium]|nr:hypothetical protein [Bacillota bacterium]
MEKNEHPKDITVILENFTKYKVIIISLALIAGFIHVQGLFSPVTDNNISFTNLFLPTSNLPIPLEMYISNGILFLVSVSFETVIAYIIYSLSASIIKKITRSNAAFSSKKPPKLLALNLFWILPAVYAIFLHFLIRYNFFNWLLTYFRLQDYDAAASVHLILWMINILYITVLLGSFSLYKLQLSSLLTSKVVENDILKVKKAFFILIVIYSSMFITYNNGFIIFQVKVERALEEKGGIDFVRVYFKKDSGLSPLSCYRVYMTDKYFLGYFYATKKTILFPCEIIAKVEKWRVVGKAEEKKQYIPTNIYNTSPGLDTLPPEQPAAATVENYYRYRTGWLYAEKVGKMDPSKIFPLFSNKYHQSFSHCRNPELFANRANMPNSYTQSSVWQEHSEENLALFYGFELAVPKLLPNNMYEVSVYEIWQDYDEFATFTLINENGKWLIDNIDWNAKPFNFIVP